MRLPRVVGHDPFGLAIGISQFKLGNKHGSIPKKLIAAIANMSAEPAVGQLGGNRVVAAFQQ